MSGSEWMVEQFEEQRGRLRGVAYRMLGSLSEAEDAVQEAWLRLDRAGAEGIDNLGGWLTTVVARVCLDVLRSRKSKREEPLEEDAANTIADRKEGIDPEQEAVMADSVGLALLVVLETLGPAERLAFVLHDMFDLPFEEIAGIVGRTPNAARQLASRARRRVQGRRAAGDADAARKREVVEAFLAAARRGDFEALLTLLDPEVVLHADAAAVRVGARESRGAATLAERAVKAGARAARPMLIDGEVGVVVAPRGRLRMVMRLTVVEGKIVEVEAVADPARLERMELAVLED